jgi:DNA-binding transcriptional MerR regulator
MEQAFYISPMGKNNGLLHPIRAVSRMTGLSAHTIRAWERRYEAIHPARTDSRRRLYSDAEVERLRLLKRLTTAGRSIGQIAGLSEEELRRLAAADHPSSSLAAGETEEGSAFAERIVVECLQAARDLDGRTIESRLLQASVALPHQALIDGVIAPLLTRLGELWQHGQIRPAQEHLATAVLRTFLGNLIADCPVPPSAPDAVFATPAGQVHEFGALAAAATAAAEGWRVSYLGTSLPAEDIAATAISRGARVVGLSIVFPADDAHLHSEIVRLDKLLPAGVTLFVGGRSAGAYRAVAESRRVFLIASLPEFRARLRKARSAPVPAPAA